ncbi:MAG: TolC family protein, partial [Gemmatimonadales bacterium]
MTTFSILRIATVAVLLASAVTPVPAQRGALTLQDAIALAQQKGLQAQGALGARDAARSRDKLFTTLYLPSLTIGGTAPSYQRSIQPITQPDGSVLYHPVQQTTAGLTASIIQRIPWTNTTLNFTSGLNEVQVNGTPGFRTWSSTPFSVGITQPILRANSQAWDIRQQDLRFLSSERKYLESREDVAIAVTGSYFDLHSATLTLNNETKNAATNDTLYTLNKGRFEVGKIGENDLLQSELALLRARSALDDARLAFERALSQFRIALNLPPGSPVEIAVTATVPSFDADTTVAIEQARKNASAMSDAELNEVSAERSVRE